MSGPVANNIFRASGVVAAAAGGLNWNSTIFTALTTFTVTVQNVSGNKYFIDGVQQQTLNLLEGFTYKFDQSDSSNSSHPLRFSTTSGGSHGGGSEYTTGVTTSGTPGSSGAYTQIVVASGAPVLYYYCTAHSGMGGTANTTAETVEANRGYWIDTTSTTCTITLPSSPSKGDQIILVDYARTWGTNKITLDSNGLNYQGSPDTFTLEYSTSGEVLNIVYSDATKGWIPQDDDEVADAPDPPPTQRAILGYGRNTSNAKVNTSNLINSSGVVGNDVTGVGTARRSLGAVSYGGDKAIFGYGLTDSRVSMTNLVNNSGVVGSDVSGVGTARSGLGTTTYGTTGQAMFAYGENASSQTLNTRNLVNSSGVVASDASGAGSARQALAGNAYGVGLGIFAYGTSNTNVSNLVSNTGVVSADVTGVGTGRQSPGASGYGTGLAIFAFGEAAGSDFTNVSNKVSFTGVVASDTSGVGTGRNNVAAASYGGDKGIFSGGETASAKVGMTNLVSNTGVVASDVAAVATAREAAAASGYSYSA